MFNTCCIYYFLLRSLYTSHSLLLMIIFCYILWMIILSRSTIQVKWKHPTYVQEGFTLKTLLKRVYQSRCNRMQGVLLKKSNITLLPNIPGRNGEYFKEFRAVKLSLDTRQGLQASDINGQSIFRNCQQHIITIQATLIKLMGSIFCR